MHWLLRDCHGRAVLVFNPHCLDQAQCSVARYQHMGMYLMEQATNCPEVQRRGVALIFDCRQMPLSLLYQFTLEDVQRGTRMWQGAFPCRVRQIYILGLSRATGNIVRSTLFFFTSSKMRSRVVMVPTPEALAALLGEDFLPTVLGGQLKDFDWERQMQEHIRDGKPLI
uniref:CRAL-TRIO domain-containing protein n=2 Tax=Rhizochromulina marina TaxID=1034831 RepID=A0A7S2WW88_9STRA|mmetsp:Transcript_8097/g.22990  ORF Transcript_8097/g.22990 Transcript_8097/m.22990 type:complete len:169 (+) Transcript_8097:105-611(+)